MGIPCYFINLDRATGRRAHMEHQGQRIGMSLMRITAIDGEQLSREDLEKWIPPGPSNGRLTPGETACFLSHRKAWERVAEGDATHGAIFEDDVILSDDATALMQDSQWIPEGVDLVKVETFMRNVYLQPPYLAAPTGRTLARLAYQHYGAGGYIISRQCATKLLAATKTFHVAVDLAIFSPKQFALPHLNVMQLSPAICIQQMQSPQDPCGSKIEASALQDSRLLAKGGTAGGMRHAAKQVGQSLENAVRLIKQNLRAALTRSRWGIVEFR